MIFLAGSEASGKTKKAFAYGWKERKTSEDGVLLFSLQHEKKEMWKILQSMYGQEELSKIEIDDTPAIMVERMAEIIAQKAENGAISVFVIDEVPMMTSRKNFTDRKEELRYMIGLLKKCEKKERVVIVAVIPVSKYCTEMQKMRKKMGLSETSPSMHMLFSGNPGTAKTTVARLLSQVLKEEEVLKYGHIVECGRQDLVGKYVGWTAQIVESKFQAARGGILFIDEAYSLVEDNRTYGAEAINTIVQEMENYRDEVIVIFAGYPEKMKGFLEQNEGLASRIAFHLNFPDYSPEELTQILDLMLEKSEYRMDERTREKCFSICVNACREENYGNGRFVRNLLDHAIMRQADRLIREHQNGMLGKEEACLLTADDFEMIGLKKKPQIRQIGFCAG